MACSRASSCSAHAIAPSTLTRPIARRGVLDDGSLASAEMRLSPQSQNGIMDGSHACEGPVPHRFSVAFVFGIGEGGRGTDELTCSAAPDPATRLNFFSDAVDHLNATEFFGLGDAGLSNRLRNDMHEAAHLKGVASPKGGRGR